MSKLREHCRYICRRRPALLDIKKRLTLKSDATASASQKGLPVRGQQLRPTRVPASDLEEDNAIELDVTRQKTGVLVIFHDADLMRMTGKPDKIRDMSYEELSQINTASHWGRFSRIPGYPRWRRYWITARIR